jgi:hypothetical protein
VENYFDYLRAMAHQLGERIVQTYPALQSPKDAPAKGLEDLLRTPLPAQALAITGLVKYLRKAHAARIVAECGAGKTFMSLGTIHIHAGTKPYSAIVMCPPHIVQKWAREVLLTVPHARTFIIEDLRNGGDPKKAHGIVEVKLEKGAIVAKGITTTLPKLRSMGRKGWSAYCAAPAYFIMGKEKGKLGYYWKHVFNVAKCGPELGGLINSDTGHAVALNEGGYLSKLDLRDAKHKESFKCGKDGTTRFSALWQADRDKIQRMAPADFIGRYMTGWWDYAVADELHQLAGDTAQGNGLGVLARCADKIIALTGTLMGGFADDLFNIFYRMEPRRMVADGYEAGSQGRKDFQEQYGVLETVEKVQQTDNACTKAQKRTVQVLRKPGASPLLFGKYLMESTAFITLEDISDQLPPYEETVISVDMDENLARAYEEVEKDIKSAMKAHRGNKSLMSVMLNTLLLYPDHPYGIGPIWGKQYDPKEKRMAQFFVTEPENLPENVTYAKERTLIDDIRAELRQGRRCQVYATFTGKHDVTAQLERILQQAGFRVAVLRATVTTDKREAWYERQLCAGAQVVICHPKLVETGLDLLAFPTLYFYETGYSLHTLRQASRRSWRIGQKHPVRVKFLAYRGTMQETCIRYMGKKLLVALMMEGKFSGEGLQSLDADEDMLTAMARELVEKGGVGESAASIWRELEKERARQAPDQPNGHAVPVQSVEVQRSAFVDEPLALDFELSASDEQGLHLVHSKQLRPKRKSVPLWPTGGAVGEQLSLFG